MMLGGGWDDDDDCDGDKDFEKMIIAAMCRDDNHKDVIVAMLQYDGGDGKDVDAF